MGHPRHSGQARGRCSLTVTLALCCALHGCQSPPATVPPPAGDPPPPPPAVAPAQVFAPGPADPGRVPSPRRAAAVPRVDAVDLDQAYAREGVVPARRLVYRVRLRVPPGLGKATAARPQPTSEIQVDVSGQRLRARFVGKGWPVPPGSEVRLRDDRPGTYVFDGQGGRPLPPGQLAVWFQGGELGSFRPLLGVRPPPPNEVADPGSLVCALLAEWAGQPREDLVRRCEAGPPLLFRLGPYRAERTADVPVELERAALRADHLGAPAPVQSLPYQVFFEASVLARLAASSSARGAPSATLEVDNAGGSRALLTVDGLAVGALDAGAELTLDGLLAGRHVVGAMRPLGAPVLRGRAVVLPATVTIRH